MRISTVQINNLSQVLLIRIYGKAPHTVGYNINQKGRHYCHSQLLHCYGSKGYTPTSGICLDQKTGLIVQQDFLELIPQNFLGSISNK